MEEALAPGDRRRGRRATARSSRSGSPTTRAANAALKAGQRAPSRGRHPRARTMRRTRHPRRPASRRAAPRLPISSSIARSLPRTIAAESSGSRAEGQARRDRRGEPARAGRRSRTAAGVTTGARRPGPGGWRATSIARAPARAVAGAQMMIEEGERPIGRQRAQPERQAGELHRRRVQIHAVEASLGDGAAERGAIRRRDVRRGSPRPPRSARLRMPPPGSGTPRRGTRRCPSPDPRRAARGSAQATRPRTSGASVRRTRYSVIDRGV